MSYNRNPEYKFIDTDVNPLLADLLAGFERITGRTAQPASKDRLYIQWVANIIIHERALTNYAANQNLPSRAEGDDLDELGQLFYELERPDKEPAVCKVRFYISETQMTSILVPAGTRVTDISNSLIWATKDDKYIAIGERSADVDVVCQTPGVVGNNYALGQINTLVDVNNIAHYERCENISVSDGGSDRACDDEYYELMRLSAGSSSTAGARGAYVYFAKKVSREIADVVPVTPKPGQVNIYVLMKDGVIASEEMKKKVYEACNPDDVRPLTDYVVMDDPEVVEYEIDFEFYILQDAELSSADIESAVDAAVEDYVAWQCKKLGRDINPDELVERVKRIPGIKRVPIISPTYRVLRDGKEKDPDIPRIPQIASVRKPFRIVNGGYENE